MAGCAPLGAVREGLDEAEPEEREVAEESDRGTPVVDDSSRLSGRDALMLALLNEPDRAPDDRPRVSVRTSQRLVHAVRGMHYAGTLRDWLDEFGGLLAVTDRVHQLRPAETCRESFECFEQVTSDGLPVFGSYVQGRSNAEGELVLVLADTGVEPARDETSHPIDEAEAVSSAREHLGAAADAQTRQGSALMDGVAIPVWEVEFQGITVTVDASTGAVIGEREHFEGLDARQVFRATSGLPPNMPEDGLPDDQDWSNYTLIWSNTSPYSTASPYSAPTPWPGTSALINGYVQDTRNFFTWWGRDGWDNDAGSAYHRMRAAADVDHVFSLFPAYVPPGYASWSTTLGTNPNRASTFFGPQAACLDVVAHEFFHGVEQDEIGTPSAVIDATEERRAIWEGLSDSVGRFTERQYGAAPDWVIGTGGTCTGYRSMSDPEAPSSIAGGSCSSCYFGSSHYSNYQRWDANGGNSGAIKDFQYANATIVDRAAYLMGRDTSAGATTFAGRTVTGIGNINASFVVYDVVRDHLALSDTMYDMTNAWVDASALRFGTPSTNFTNAVAAIQAVGLWYGGYLEPDIGSESRSSFAPFTVSGQARTYVAYRGYLTNDLRVRYRASTLSGSIWSSATTIASSSSGPSLQPHGGALWVAYRNTATNVVTTRTLTSSGSWTAAASLPGSVTTDSDVALMEFGGNLYVFYRSLGSGSRPIHYMVRSGGTWYGPSTTGASSDSGPAAAVVGNRLYVVYRRGTTSLNMFYRYLETSLFSDELNVPRQTSQHLTTSPAQGTPTAIGYRGRLHVAARSTDNRTRYSSYCYCASNPCACTYRAGEWTQTVSLPQQVAMGPPVLYTDAGGAAPFDNPLYLVYPVGAHAYRDLKISE